MDSRIRQDNIVGVIKMSKKVNIIVTQPPYGKEDAYSAIPLAETQAAAGNSPSITFVSGGVHSVVKGQKPGYGDAAVWQKDVPSIEASITKSLSEYSFIDLKLGRVIAA